MKQWYDRAMEVKRMSDSLYGFADRLKWEIAREADGKKGNPNALENKEDLEAAGHVMLAPVRGQGKALYATINAFRDRAISLLSDSRQKEVVASNFSTEVPQHPDNIGRTWESYMFEEMPAIAAITLLTKIQNDVRNTEGELLHTLISNIDLKDIRVNELNAYVLADATTLFPGETFNSRIFMAAEDTTQRPEIYVNGERIADDGSYSFRVGRPGQYTFSGYMQMPNAAGEMVRREFTQKYNVIAPPSGATVAADLMNVLYAGYDNPMTIAAAGIPHNKLSVSMSGGTLTASGPGKYVARPKAVGEDALFTVRGEVNGRMQDMGKFSFKVRKLPDPTAYINIGNDRFKGGKLAKGDALGAKTLGAAIDDGLLDIPFKVLSFETVFFDRMGNTRPEPSSGANFTEAQRELMRSLRRSQRFYISRVRVIGPDGIERTLPTALEVIVN